MKLADEEYKMEEKERATAAKNSKKDGMSLSGMARVLMCSGKGAKQEPMETVILEKTIIKLGSLLALGFGEAGSNIIGHNMHGVDSACVDAMVDGTIVECIIGQIRVRDF